MQGCGWRLRAQPPPCLASHDEAQAWRGNVYVLISREARPSAHIVYYSWFLNAATLGLRDGVFLIYLVCFYSRLVCLWSEWYSRAEILED